MANVFLLVAKLVALCVIFISAYCMIWLRHSITPIVYIFLCVYLVPSSVVIMPTAVFMSQIYNISQKFHENVRSQLEMSKMGQDETKSNILLDKTLKSLPVLKSTIETFYHMEGRAKLTLADSIAHRICSTLLSLK